jgi:hypothetical protein
MNVRKEARTDAGREAVSLRGLLGGETFERATDWILLVEQQAASAAINDALGRVAALYDSGDIGLEARMVIEEALEAIA